MKTYRIEIDANLCSAFGSCVDAAPHVFELNGGGVADARTAETDDAGVVEAARSCPMGAIAVYRADGCERVA
jgi:ferredoxin